MPSVDFFASSKAISSLIVTCTRVRHCRKINKWMGLLSPHLPLIKTAVYFFAIFTNTTFWLLTVLLSWQMS